MCLDQRALGTLSGAPGVYKFVPYEAELHGFNWTACHVKFHLLPKRCFSSGRLWEVEPDDGMHYTVVAVFHR